MELGYVPGYLKNIWPKIWSSTLSFGIWHGPFFQVVASWVVPLEPPGGRNHLARGTVMVIQPPRGNLSKDTTKWRDSSAEFLLILSQPTTTKKGWLYHLFLGDGIHRCSVIRFFGVNYPTYIPWFEHIFAKIATSCTQRTCHTPHIPSYIYTYI